MDKFIVNVELRHLEDVWGKICDMLKDIVKPYSKALLETNIIRKQLGIKTQPVIDTIHNIIRNSEKFLVLEKDGEEMYQVIYQTYINPDFADVWDLFSKLALSRRRYYYLRENAFKLMSLILWAGPTTQIARWWEILQMLEDMKME